MKKLVEGTPLLQPVCLHVQFWYCHCWLASSLLAGIINPRCACAARVIVVVVCVCTCMCVCMYVCVCVYVCMCDHS